MKIDYKNLDFIDPKLREMMSVVEQRYGFEFTITSLYRMNDNGVHGTLPVRGVDLRCYDTHLGEMIARNMNNIYEYDPSRPEKLACMYHDAGSGAHLHLQCHPNTRFR